ncbi:PAS domain-containing protein [Bacillus sp. NP157]|nr:PAS domain-containing protein [Bacillus sp. NP157]
MGATRSRPVFDDVAELVRLAGPAAEGEGVVITDVTGNIVFANADAETILGFVRIGVGVEDYSSMHGVFTEDGRPYPSSDLPLARAVLSQKTTRDVRLLLRRCDGQHHLTSVTISVSGRPLYDASRRHVGAAAFFTVVST